MAAMTVLSKFCLSFTYIAHMMHLKYKYFDCNIVSVILTGTILVMVHGKDPKIQSKMLSREWSVRGT